jgi:hypothetical protein
MSAILEPDEPFGPRANELFAAHQRDIYEHTDRLIAGSSARAMTNGRDLALAGGGDDFDSKPVRFEQPLGKIERLLGRAVVTR